MVFGFSANLMDFSVDKVDLHGRRTDVFEFSVGIFWQVPLIFVILQLKPRFHIEKNTPPTRLRVLFAVNDHSPQPPAVRAVRSQHKNES